MFVLRVRGLLAAALVASASGATVALPASAATHHRARHHSRNHAHQPVRGGIPQHNGGDHDADNNGGPSDGDGNI